jgi:subtilisin family serine protease
MKKTFRNLILTTALATTLTACGGGGGGGAVSTVTNFVDNTVSQLAGSESIVSSYSSTLSTFNSLISGGDISTLSAITNPDAKTKQSASTILSTITSAETLWSQTVALIDSQSTDRKLAIYNSNSYKDAYAAYLYLTETVKPIVQKVSAGTGISTEEFNRVADNNTVTTIIAEKRSTTVTAHVSTKITELSTPTPTPTPTPEPEVTVTGTVTLDPTVTSTSVDGDPYTVTTYVDGADTTTTTTGDATTTTTTTNNIVDTANSDSSTTRKTYTITTTTTVTPITTTVTAIRTYTDVVKKDVTTTTTTTPNIRTTYSNGTSVDSTGTPVVTTAIATVIVSTTTRSETVTKSTSTENTTVTTNDNPGVLVSTVVIPAGDVVAYTDTDSNLGTKTPGYSTDKNTYETAEYFGMNGGGGDVLGSIKASSAYSRGWTGKGSTIAILDTGIDQDHQAFAGKIKATTCYVDCGNGVEDQHGHGTHVAGIAAGNKNDSVFHGVAFDSNIVAAKVAYNNGAYSLFYARQAVDWAVEQNAIVANISANSTLTHGNITNRGNGIYTSTDIQYLKEDADDWINLRTQDIVVVNSAGNQGKDYAAKPGILATMTDSSGNLYMGGKMLIVGNYYPNYSATNGGNLAGTSNAAGHLCQDWNAGTSTCNDAYRIWDFYIMAPGQQVKSAGLGGSSATMSGTSMAAPVVSGSIAILHQMWPYMKAENLVKLVLQTANKNIYGYDEKKHGQGLLDLDNATKPQGAVGIVTTGGNVSSASTASISSTGGAGGSVAQLSNILNNVMVVDEYKRDYYINLATGITAKDTRKVSSVWAKANNWSTNSFVQKYGSFTQGGEFKASNFTSMPLFSEDTQIGLYSGENGGQDWGSNILKKWKLGKGFKLKTGVGYMSEQNTWLGNATDGALTVGKNNDTRYATVGFEYELGNNMFTFDFDQGYTNVNTKAGSLITGFDTLTTQSMKIGWERQLSSNEKWGITYSLPNHITKGSANLNIPTATNLYGDIIYQDHKADMKQKTKEQNFGVYYSHQAENETDWKTTFSLEYRQNVAGVGGDNKFVPAMQVSKKFWGACMSFFGMKNERPGCQKIRLEEKIEKLSKKKGKEKEIAELKYQLLGVEKQIAKINGDDVKMAKLDKQLALGWNR